MIRLLGVILLIVGAVMAITILLAPIGIWFMLFGVLLALLGGGSRRVIIRHDRASGSPAREFFEKRRLEKELRLDEQRTNAPRADAADDFNEAVLLYQKHHGHKDAGSAIRVLATDALRRQGFLR